jgi:hypothetical protein
MICTATFESPDLPEHIQEDANGALERLQAEYQPVELVEARLGGACENPVRETTIHALCKVVARPRRPGRCSRDEAVMSAVADDKAETAREAELEGLRTLAAEMRVSAQDRHHLEAIRARS